MGSGKRGVSTRKFMTVSIRVNDVVTSSEVSEVLTVIRLK